jgi:hypothetical protein
LYICQNIKTKITRPVVEVNEKTCEIYLSQRSLKPVSVWKWIVDRRMKRFCPLPLRPTTVC